LYQAKDIKGIKAEGLIKKSSLALQNLSIENIGGASIKGEGIVADLNNLSGINAKVSAAISDVQSFATFAGLDAKTLPQQVKSAHIDAAVAGDMKTLDMTTTVKALDGSLTAKGKVQNVQTSPAVDNLAIAIKHPNFAQALKTFMPA